MDERSNREGPVRPEPADDVSSDSISSDTPQGSLSTRAIPLGSRPMSWMTPRRVLHTLTAPAEVRSPARTAEPAVTPIATMPAALAAIISQLESPTYQHRFGSTPRTRLRVCHIAPVNDRRRTRET